MCVCVCVCACFWMWWMHASVGLYKCPGIFRWGTINNLSLCGYIHLNILNLLHTCTHTHTHNRKKRRKTYNYFFLSKQTQQLPSDDMWACKVWDKQILELFKSTKTQTFTFLITNPPLWNSICLMKMQQNKNFNSTEKKRRKKKRREKKRWGGGGGGTTTKLMVNWDDCDPLTLTLQTATQIFCLTNSTFNEAGHPVCMFRRKLLAEAKHSLRTIIQFDNPHPHIPNTFSRETSLLWAQGWISLSMHSKCCSW